MPYHVYTTLTRLVPQAERANITNKGNTTLFNIARVKGHLDEEDMDGEPAPFGRRPSRN